MPGFERLWENGPLFAQAEHFRLSTDCVLLADFVNTAGAVRGIDLGCASGAIALLLLARTDKLHMTGLEIVPEAASLAEENMRANALEARSDIVCGDIRRHRELFKAGSFDLIVANPPYFPVGSGKLPTDAERAAARGETQCSMEEICAASAFLCRTGGSVIFVHKPERLADVLCGLRDAGTEPKRLRFVHNRATDPPSLFLAEGCRGGRPGITVEPPLILQNGNGTPTAELNAIYFRNQEV